MNLSIAEIERVDHTKPDPKRLAGSQARLADATKRIRNSLRIVSEIRASAPAQLQQEIAVTSFYVENLADSLDQIATAVGGGSYPPAKACAASAAALQQVYGAMLRNALAKR